MLREPSRRIHRNEFAIAAVLVVGVLAIIVASGLFGELVNDLVGAAIEKRP